MVEFNLDSYILQTKHTVTSQHREPVNKNILNIKNISTLLRKKSKSEINS